MEYQLQIFIESSSEETKNNEFPGLKCRSAKYQLLKAFDSLTLLNISCETSETLESPDWENVYLEIRVPHTVGTHTDFLLLGRILYNRQTNNFFLFHKI